MNDRLNSCTDLDELFILWKEQQQNESPEEYGRYAHPSGNVDRQSFLYDGFMGRKEEFSKASPRVLFIAKEGNVGGSDADKPVSDSGDFFWAKECLENNKSPIFLQGVAKLYNAYKNNNYEKPNGNISGLREAAFMNLNKRGGYSYCFYPTLRTYTKKYADYIAREIDLIKPDVIIACGVSGLLRDFIMDKLANKDIKLYSVYHPSYRRSDTFKLKKLRCEVTGEAFEKPKYRFNINLPKPTETKGIIIDTNKHYGNY